MKGWINLTYDTDDLLTSVNLCNFRSFFENYFFLCFPDENFFFPVFGVYLIIYFLLCGLMFVFLLKYFFIFFLRWHKDNVL